MPTHTITVELSEEIYQRAEQVAQATQRAIEQVVVEWIHLSFEGEPNSIEELENLSDEQLIEIARTNISKDQTGRLQELLTLQQQRALTAAEQHEATILVEQEDNLTLQKARALFLLKQRGVLPENLATLLN